MGQGTAQAQGSSSVALPCPQVWNCHLVRRTDDDQDKAQCVMAEEGSLRVLLGITGSWQLVFQEEEDRRTAGAVAGL